jgi:primosomal protein N''
MTHELTHREFADGTLTPACTCGWYSPRREHADFERHIRKVTDDASE